MWNGVNAYFMLQQYNLLSSQSFTFDLQNLRLWIFQNENLDNMYNNHNNKSVIS